MVRLKCAGLGLVALLIVGCGTNTEAQRAPARGVAAKLDAWANDWPAFVREVESKNQLPGAEFAAFIKKYEGKPVRWTGTIEWATCERGRCSMTLRMTPDTVKLSPGSAPLLAQVLLDVADPGRKLEPDTKISFQTTLSSPLFGKRSIRLMVYNDGAQLLPDESK